MRFFHLSDLHIGKQLHYYSLKEDQERILEEIVDYARQYNPQAIVIAGDVYDKSVPSAEAVAVFDRFLRALSELDTEILVISGNHDSQERLEFASSLLEKQRVHMAGTLPEKGEFLKKVYLEDEFGTVCFTLLPFLKPAYVRELLSQEEAEDQTEAVRAMLEREEPCEEHRQVLVTHQFYTAAGRGPVRSESESVYVGGAGNVDISAVKNYEYVAMGHIHKAQSVGNPQFRYCGTPLKYSVGESKDTKTLTMVTLQEKGTAPIIEELTLHPLHEVRQFRGTLEEILEKGCEDYVSVILTDEKMPYQPREKLDRVFPRLLEIKVENTLARQFLENQEKYAGEESPLSLFSEFYTHIHGKEMSEQEQKILEKVIREAQEENV